MRNTDSLDFSDTLPAACVNGDPSRDEFLWFSNGCFPAAASKARPRPSCHHRRHPTLSPPLQPISITLKDLLLLLLEDDDQLVLLPLGNLKQSRTNPWPAQAPQQVQ